MQHLQNEIHPGRNTALTTTFIVMQTFVLDYDTDINYLYSKQMDCIIQPVEKLGETAGELILRRIETPDAPAFEQVLTSTYQPCSM